MSLASCAVVVLVIGMAACCISDLRSRTIPNELVFALLAVGFALQGVGLGVKGLVIAAGGMLAASLPLLPAFALGGVGGGDVKMMAAIGAFLGPKLGLMSVLAGMMAGGVVMSVELVRRRRFTEKLRETWTRAKDGIVERSTGPLRLSDSAPETISLPYSFPLAFGTLLVLVFTL